MKMRDLIAKFLQSTLIGRIFLIPARIFLALSTLHVSSKIKKAILWGFKSREIGGGRYNTNSDNQTELCAAISIFSGKSIEEIISYRNEIISDREIFIHISRSINASKEKYYHDNNSKLGRRLKFYLLVRAMRPGFVVEAGIDRGLGTLLIIRALERNAEEGFKGSYLGIENNKDKNILFYRKSLIIEENIIFGDSVDEISKINRPIDLFFHETTTIPTHVRAQLAAVNRIISPGGVIFLPWFTPEAIEFSLSSNWRFLTHQDQPVDDWQDGNRSMFLFRQLPLSD